MPAVQVALDLYPATVKLPDGSSLSNARTIVADGKLLVYVMSGGMPFLHFEQAVVEIGGKQPTGWYQIQTEAGSAELRKLGGCGCGSRLKTFNPFPGRTRTRVRLQ